MNDMIPSRAETDYPKALESAGRTCGIHRRREYILASVPDSVLKIIQTSGNSFHARVARWLQANGWHTQISPYYVDQNQEKSRELDLVAEKAWAFNDYFGRSFGDIHIRLFIECKFVASETIFWLAPKDRKSAQNLITSAGLFRRDDLTTEKHHYLSTSPKVGKVFASASGRPAEAEPFFKAINQALHATVAMRTRPSSHPKLTRGNTGKTFRLDFPVIVCSSFSDLYHLDFYEESDVNKIDQNFQFEVQYAYFSEASHPKNEHFLVDIVSFDLLPDFAELLEQDAQAAIMFASS